MIENTISLYILKIASIIIPLITLPYLLRVLGPEGFGTISFSQSFANFFVMIVDFGFWLSVVPLVSSNIDDKKKVSEIFSSVVIIKIFLLILCFTIYFSIINYFDRFSQNKLLNLYMFGIVIGQGLNLTWFFQSMQKMRYIAILNITIKIFFLTMILLFIKSNRDLLKYPILLSLGYIGILPFAYYIALTKFNIKFYWPSYKKILYYGKYSFGFFISRVSVQLYSSTGVLIVGFISNDLIVGYYAMADKLKNVITSLYGPIIQSLYPYLTQEKSLIFFKKIFMLVNIINLIGIVILYLFAHSILITIYGYSSELSEEILRIFALLLLIDIPSILVGYPLLGAFGFNKYLNYGLVFTSILFFIFIIILWIANLLSAKSVAMAYLGIIVFELLYRVYGVYKYKIFNKSQSK